MTETQIDETIRWFEGLCASNNEKFVPLFFDSHRYLVLKGGGGSGKSIFAGRKVLERVATEPGHRFLVVRKTGKSLRETCFEQLKSQANQFYPNEIDFIPKGKSSDMYMRFKNSGEIIFSGLDDVEKLKSIFDITGVWIEEASEITEADFNQLDIRLRTNFKYPLQMILTFNPIAVTHWLKKRFFDKKMPDSTIHESTYLDNRFVSDAQKQVLEGFRETDEYFYQVYCLGEWGVTGKSVFIAAEIAKRLGEAPKPKKRGLFEYDEAEDGVHISNIRWVDDANGPIKIFEEPEAGMPFVIGGDTAGDGSDYFTAQALNNVTGKQAAVLRHQYDEDTYARQLYCLGRYYNTALIAPETNFSTYPTKLLHLMGYTRLYVREAEDTYTGAIKQAFGFKTDKLTRPIIIANLVANMRGRAERISDDETLKEMLTFVRNEKLRPEGEAGAHDDLVMALAIADYIRPHQSMEKPRPPAEKREWRKDMWDDFNRASAEMRAEMIKRWGAPK